MTNCRVHYKLFNGQVITFDYSPFGNINMSVINDIVLRYYDLTAELPTGIYLGPRAYNDAMMGGVYANALPPSTDPKVKHYVLVNTPAGLLPLIPVAKPGPDFVLIGQDKDYQYYNLDEVFEDEVLTK